LVKRSIRTYEKIGWQAKPPAAPLGKALARKVGQAVSPAVWVINAIFSHLLTERFEKTILHTFASYGATDTFT
jgi:hypothetical protein